VTSAVQLTSTLATENTQQTTTGPAQTTSGSQIGLGSPFDFVPQSGGMRQLPRQWLEAIIVAGTVILLLGP
jgi:hypothetical protein